MTTQQSYALLALHVYAADIKNKPLLQPPWTELLPQPAGTDSFAYAVYQNSATNEVVISFRGTDSFFGDLPTNIGISISQEKQAAAVYARVLRDYGVDAIGSNITFTGHSLGGGLAATMAVWFNRPAVVFDPAPSEYGAKAYSNVSQVIDSLGSLVPQSLLDYRAGILAQFATRESNVTSYYAPGSALYSLSTADNTITGAGEGNPVQFGIANMGSIAGRIDMHSQELLTAGLLSKPFADATVAVQWALPLIMDKQFYALDPEGEKLNFLIDLIRSEQGTGDKLSHFAADLNKLGTNIAGLNKAAQDAIIAQGIEWYYWQGTDYAGQEFFTLTGESLQYATAQGDGLAGAQNKATAYIGKWLTPIVNDHGAFYSTGFATYDQWNVVTGGSGGSLTALKSDKSQIFIGGTGGDTFTGGDLDDVMFAGAGADTLDGGDGNDELYGGADNDTLRGGAGYDIYRIEGDDTIEDSDGVGSITDKSGQRITGAIEKRSDGSYAFLSDSTITVAGGADLTLTLADGSGVTIKNFQSGDLGLHLNDTAATPETTRTIVGDLAPVDFDPSTSGLQSRLDDLDNVIVDPDQPRANQPDYLYDSAGNDDIKSYGGDDYIEAWRGGDDRLDGGSGDDIVVGRNGDDIIIGGEGLDLLRGDAGHDRLYAGTEVTLDAALAAQDDTASGLKGDFIDGSEGDDVAVGDTGNDALDGGQGDDIILGGAGDDTIRGDLKTSSVTKDWSISRSVTTDANGVTLYYSTYNNVSFSAPTDGGDDVIFAGAGVDWVMAEDGDDYIDGGSGDDVLFGQRGRDDIFGGTGNDHLIGDSASLPLAEHGDDYLDGEEGDDRLSGDGGNDQLFGGAGNDQLYGGEGEDYLDGEEGDDILVGGAEGDVLFGGDGADYLQGDAGNGEGDGNDYLDGGAGDDILLGLGGQDELHGGAGNDQLQGGEGNDTLAGGEGSDVLFGESGNDTLQGGAGTDYLLGGLGDDSLDGGEGDDVYYYTRGEGNDRISDSGGTDWLVFNDIYWGQVQLGVGSLKLTIPGGEIHLDDFDPDNPLAAGGIEYFQFGDGSVMSKTQLIQALGFNIQGTPGDDVLTGTALGEPIPAYAGNDIVSGRGGNDTLDLGDGDDWADGGDGNDTILGGAGSDMILGGYGADTLDGGIGGDVLYGDAGNDRLVGGDGDGDDLLSGGAGSDTLEGGAGNDTYLFGAGDGQDAASDGQGQDAIHLAGLDAGQVTFVRSGNDLLVSVKTTTDRLTVKNWYDSATSFQTLMLGDGTALDHAGVEALMPRNQAPVAAEDAVAVSEDGVTFVSGNALLNDADPEGRALRVTNPGAYGGAYGSLSLNQNGAFTYALNNTAAAVQSLAAGQVATERFGYGVSDDDPNGAATAGSHIVVTLTGANDAPQASADFAGVTEDLAPVASGNVLANDRDVDAGAVLSVTNPGTLTSAYGSLALSADGQYLYRLDSQAAQSLGRNALATERFNFTVTDGLAPVASSLAVTIRGTNDAPVVMAALPDQSVSANSAYTWRVPAGSFLDPDYADTLSYSATLADGTALPSWLAFDSVTQTFAGRVPRTATGYLDIQVGATDGYVDEGGLAQTGDVFRLNFAPGTGGGGGGTHGNAGVGNGPDAPPPGHDYNFNDGAGTSPGNPGARGGNGYVPPRRADLALARVEVAPVGLQQATSPAAAAGQGHRDNGQHLGIGAQQREASSAATMTGWDSAAVPADAASARAPGAPAGPDSNTAASLAGFLARDIHEPVYLDPAWINDPAWHSGPADNPGQGDIMARWARVDAGLALVLKGGGALSAAQTDGAAVVNHNAFLGSTMAWGNDPLGLSLGSGNALKTFKGLDEGLRKVA